MQYVDLYVGTYAVGISKYLKLDIMQKVRYK